MEKCNYSGKNKLIKFQDMTMNQTHVVKIPAIPNIPNGQTANPNIYYAHTMNTYNSKRPNLTKTTGVCKRQLVT
jgi:hypothetical protein